MKAAEQYFPVVLFKTNSESSPCRTSEYLLRLSIRACLLCFARGWMAPVLQAVGRTDWFIRGPLSKWRTSNRRNLAQVAVKRNEINCQITFNYCEYIHGAWIFSRLHEDRLSVLCGFGLYSKSKESLRVREVITLNIVGSIGNVWNLTTKTSVEPRVH